MLENLGKINALPLEFQDDNERMYPVALFGSSRIGFKHYANEDEARTKFERRRKRIDMNNLFVKIDFRYEWYKETDIERWNDLKLPNSIAFVQEGSKFSDIKIHNKLVLGPKTGFKNDFEESIRKFCWWAWLKKSVVRPLTGTELWLINRIFCKK